MKGKGKVSRDVKELETYIEKVIVDWHVAGAAVSVVKDDEVVSCRGYGMRELGKDDPVDSDTIFGIGSNTKSFTAAGVGILVDEGRLKWDDPIVQYLPDFAMHESWATKEATIRDMLSHRSGMGRAMRMLYNKTFSNKEIVHRLRYLKPVDRFRNQFGYNNFHYMIVGLVIEAVTGLSWPEFMTERFFEPLGMERSFPDLKSTLGKGNLSGAHANIEDSLLPHHSRLFAPEISVPWDDVGNQPAGGINSSAYDLTHWIRMLLSDGVWEGKQIISSATLEQMTTPCSLMLDLKNSMMAPIAAMKPEIHFYTYGMGWFVMDYKGMKMVMHGGQITGFNSAVVILPEARLGFSILVNSHQTVCHIPLVFKIADFFLGGSQRDWSQEYLGAIQSVHQQELAEYQNLLDSRKKDTHPSLPLSAYAGEFINEFMGTTNVSFEKDRLRMRYGIGYQGDLVHWQDDTFYARWENRTFDHNFVSFKLDHGKVIAVEVKDEALYRRV